MPKDNYFLVVDGIFGQIDFSKVENIEAVRKFFKIYELKDEEEWLKEFEKHLKSDNYMLRFNAECLIDRSFLKETIGEMGWTKSEPFDCVVIDSETNELECKPIKKQKKEKRIITPKYKKKPSPFGTYDR